MHYTSTPFSVVKDTLKLSGKYMHICLKYHSDIDLFHQVFIRQTHYVKQIVTCDDYDNGSDEVDHTSVA